MDAVKRARYDGNQQNGSQYVQLRGQQYNNNKSSLQTGAFPFATMLPADSFEVKQVRDRVNEILGGNQDGSIPSPLPGTLARRDLPLFKTNAHSYRICEKSDGERSLMYLNLNGCYLINRKFQIQKVQEDQFGLFQNLANFTGQIQPATTTTSTAPDSTDCSSNNSGDQNKANAGDSSNPSESNSPIQPTLLRPNQGLELLLDGEIILNYFDPEKDGFKSQKEMQETSIPHSLIEDMKTAGNVDSYFATQMMNQRYVYCMFDCAYYDDKSVQPNPLLSRLDFCSKVKKRVKDYIIAKVKQLFPVSEYPQLKTDQDCYEFYIWKHSPLRFETKDFQKAIDMRRILRTIYQFKNEKGFVYVNTEKKLKAKNDGFIFTPEYNDYMMKSNAELCLYKYKWPGLNTVDFHILSPYFDSQQKLMLFCHGYDGSGQGQRKTDFEFARVSLSPEERDYVLSRVESVDKAVVECNYERHRGNWVVKHLRTDKHKGNFFSTVLSCMEAMIDNLQPSELEEFLRKP